MNMLSRCEGHKDAASPMDGDRARFELSIRVTIDDPGLLWRAAAAAALSRSGCDDSDLEELLGPIEDPDIADCLTMLLGPRALSGCMYEAFAVAPLGGAGRSATRPAVSPGGVRRLRRPRDMSAGPADTRRFPG